MLTDLNPTTRCFPRTMSDAWQQDNFDWWEDPPPRHWTHKAFLWIGITIWLGLSLYFWSIL